MWWKSTAGVPTFKLTKRRSGREYYHVSFGYSLSDNMFMFAHDSGDYYASTENIQNTLDHEESSMILPIPTVLPNQRCGDRALGSSFLWSYFGGNAVQLLLLSYRITCQGVRVFDHMWFAYPVLEVFFFQYQGQIRCFHTRCGPGLPSSYVRDRFLTW